MKVTPKIVSGRVVNISSFRSEPWMSKKTWAPSERPIQLRWISFSESAPLEPFQSVEHPLGVGRYAEQPLFHLLLFDG